jgi:ubiquinone/menaquinone biosynthesis C-methylase UbiE
LSAADEPQTVEPDQGWSAAGFFTENADSWDEIYRSADVIGVIHQLRLETAREYAGRLALGEGARALEIGCGAGHMSVWLAEQGIEVWAGDLVPQMLRTTVRRASEQGQTRRVHASLLDAQALPFPDGSFDLVVALGVLPWVVEPEKAIGEMARVLRPGGFLITNASNKQRLSWFLDPMMNPSLEGLRGSAKRALSDRGITFSFDRGPRANIESPKGFERSLGREGLMIVDSTSIGFGPFTLLLRELLPQGAAVSLHRRLQHLADGGLPLIRTGGAQHLVLATLRTSQPG